MSPSPIQAGREGPHIQEFPQVWNLDPCFTGKAMKFSDKVPRLRGRGFRSLS